MSLSEKIWVNVNAVQYSKCGKFLAFGHFNALTVIRTRDEILVSKSFCTDEITAIDWSSDSKHILCVVSEKNSVEIFSLRMANCLCVIRGGDSGLGSAVWSPTSSYILTISEWAVRLTVWSLRGRSVGFIETPLMKPRDKLAFSPDGKYLAIVDGSFENYNISIFSTYSWITVKQIQCSNKISVPSVPLWSPNGLHVVLWETFTCGKSILEIYSSESEKLVGKFTNFKNKNKFTGIRSVVWCPNTQFLLIGCYNEQIYVLNYITWNVMFVFHHHNVVYDNECRILHNASNNINPGVSVIKDRPVVLTSVLPCRRQYDVYGISNMLFSNDGVYVASQSKLTPAVVRIWNMNLFSLTAIIILKNRITDLKWSPSKSNLLICSETNTVTVWNPHQVQQINPSNSEFEIFHQGYWRPCANGEYQELSLLTTQSMYLISIL